MILLVETSFQKLVFCLGLRLMGINNPVNLVVTSNEVGEKISINYDPKNKFRL